MAEGNALLKRHTVSSCIEGSNPSLSANAVCDMPRYAIRKPPLLRSMVIFGDLERIEHCRA